MPGTGIFFLNISGPDSRKQHPFPGGLSSSPGSIGVAGWKKMRPVRRPSHLEGDLPKPSTFWDTAFSSGRSNRHWAGLFSFDLYGNLTIKCICLSGHHGICTNPADIVVGWAFSGPPDSSAAVLYIGGLFDSKPPFNHPGRQTEAARGHISFRCQA